MTYYINNLNQKIAYKYIKGKSPGIIFIHGMNSDMSGQKAISIQKYAKRNKIAFLRFDCRGHGKSYGKFEDFTLSDWKKDLIEVIDNLTKGPQILIGSSMGGWLMLLASKLRNKKIAGLIGLAATADFGNDLYKTLSAKSKKELKINKKTKHVWSYGFSYILTKKFFIDAQKNNILTKSINFKKPVILIHGIKDSVVNSSVPITIMKKLKSKKVEINFLKSSDHRLSSKNDLECINNAITRIRNQIL